MSSCPRLPGPMMPRRKGVVSVAWAIWRAASASPLEDCAGVASSPAVKDWPSVESVTRVDAVATAAPSPRTNKRRSIMLSGSFGGGVFLAWVASPVYCGTGWVGGRFARLAEDKGFSVGHGGEQLAGC